VALEPIEVAGDPPVRGVLHPADGAGGLVLTHGAGGTKDVPLLVEVAEAFVARGVSVLRCDLPYRQARPHGPPSPAGAARDRAGLGAALAVLRERVTGRLFLGGHSYGGRMASMLLAEQPGWPPRCFCSPTRCILPGSRTGVASSTCRGCAR
jgi:predicted alpha/beta-hydrolase family hydrolase